MVSPIGAIGSVAGAIPTPAGVGSAKGTGFQDLFDRAVAGVENLKQTADQKTERFLAGEGEELHSTILATQRAELAFELFLQVRNKVVQAYQEVMRMQI
jgi:flagellar hook-basal body complex protein FliE